MNIKETLKDLGEHVQRLEAAHKKLSMASALVQMNMEAFAKDLEIARHNFAILQDLYIRKNAIPTEKN
jgi:hypothetical protein